MNWTQEIQCLQRALPLYCNFGLFFVFHWVRMLLCWCHKTCVKPFERYLESCNKVEPEEDQWIQIYTISDGGTENVFRSSEKYFFPYTTHFLKFVENEFRFFLENPLIRAVDEDNIENLFVVKNKTQYVVKSYPVFQIVLSPMNWDDFPEKSEISFSFVEYYHPKMARPLEIVLPLDYYTVGNELFTNAFVLRQLELMNCYFVFDKEYEIHFMDHEINETHLKSHEFIEIKANAYIVRNRDPTPVDSECIVEEPDDSSVLSETRYWWETWY